MAQRTVDIPGIGEVLLAKRRGATNIRLSITPTGKVRVGMPAWAPYAAGIAFAKTRADWINQHLAQYQSVAFKNNMLIGKSHRLQFIQNLDKHGVTSRVSTTAITVTSDRPLQDPIVQTKIKLAAEKALRQEADVLLPKQLDYLAKKYDFTYSSVQIRKLTSRWGSCSSKQSISLSYYLMQLPWKLIDYVLVHELVHTEQLNHGTDFWRRFDQALPGAKKLRGELRNYKPKINPSE